MWSQCLHREPGHPVVRGSCPPAHLSISYMPVESVRCKRIDFRRGFCHNIRSLDFLYMKLTRFLSLALGFTLSMASADESLYTGSFWTDGVSASSGWYDANKIDNSNNDADDNMCYAASAANIIAWWQNSTVGSTLTSNSPKELGDIWQTFINANKEEYWDEGGDPLAAINWWISGVYSPENLNDTAGWERYYVGSDEWDGDMLSVSLRGTEGYYFDQYGLDNKKLANFLMDMQMYSDSITNINFAELLQNNCAISLGIQLESEDAGHAITLWGVEYDENGKLKTIWITDSDDEYEGIVKVSVTVDEENDKIWLGKEYSDLFNYYIELVCVVDARESFKWSTLSAEKYVSLKINPETHNGRAGVTLLADVFMNEEKDDEEEEDAQSTAAARTTTEEETEVETALESIITAMDKGRMNDRDAAAVAGASTSVLGQALSGDVQRQLSAIRNRAAMGSGSQDAAVLDDKSGSLEQPDRFFAWINAEGNRAEQESDGSAAGYTLSNWGGTVGAGMMVNNQLSMGLAVTAMYGDLKSDGPDSLDGDMNTTYLSAFARYNTGNWSHSVIGTFGLMEADYNRAAMSYTNSGDTDGTTFGVMYELSRGYALDDWSSISPVFNISYRHIAVDGYTESGTDAALNVGKQDLDTVTLALGARYNAVVGRQTLNRACAFDSRALLKFDLGDTQSDASVGIVNYASRTTIESAELSPFALEIGAGIAVPVGYGSIFADVAVELRNEYTNLNAAVGYKLQF